MQGSQAERYLNNRWQSQRDYYSKRSNECKRWHQGLLLISIVCAPIVPALINFKQVPTIVPIILSLLVSAALALDNVFQFGDNWRDFRQTLETLKQEKVFYEYNISPYDDPQTAFPLFIQRCEKITEVEGKSYFKRHESQKQVVNSQDNSPYK